MFESELPPLLIFLLIFIWIIVGAAAGIIKTGIQLSGKAVYSVTRNTSQKNKVYSKQLRIASDKKEKEEAKKSLEAILNDIVNKTREAKNFIIGLAQHLLAQVIDNEEQKQEEKKDVFEDNFDNKEDVDTLEQPTVFSKHAGQKMLGAILELTALLIFLYADAAQTANTISGLYPGTPIPSWLTNITIPLIAASAGAVFLLGMFIGDLIGATHLTNLTKAGKLPKWVLATLMITTLVLTIGLSTYSALYRVPILNGSIETEAGKLIANRANIAQSLTIIPLLITTFLLFRGVLGIFVVLGLITYGFVLPFAILEFAIQILSKLVSAGLVESWVVLVRLLNFSLGALDLIFGIISTLIQTALKILALIITIIFFVPYLLVNLPLKAWTGQTIDGHLDDMLRIDFRNNDYDYDDSDNIIDAPSVDILPPSSN